MAAPTKEQIDAIVEFGCYRGVIESVEIPKVWSVGGSRDGEQILIIGRRNATKIVQALNSAGYDIVRRSVALPGDDNA